MLARDDPKQMEHFLERANQDYRDVLWWAEIRAEEDMKKKDLQAMTVNERLAALDLLGAWNAAVAGKNRTGAAAVLRKCGVSDFEIERIVEGAFRG